MKVVNAIMKMKPEKAWGIDHKTVLIWKFCKDIWMTRNWREDWMKGIFLPLSKKRNIIECGNYYIISLISHESKVMLYIIQDCMKWRTEAELSPQQAGFREGWGTCHQVTSPKSVESTIMHWSHASLINGQTVEAVDEFNYLGSYTYNPKETVPKKLEDY